MRPTREGVEGFKISPERWNAALEYFRKHRRELIEAAAFSRDNAVSHRKPPFEVGAAVIGIEPNLPEGEYGVYQAYNFKPEPGERKGKEKLCAERNALSAARNWAKGVVAIATVSREISTGDPTKAHDALHPCAECRQLFRELLDQGFLKEDTMICNANDSEKDIKVEERTLRELLDLYKDD